MTSPASPIQPTVNSDHTPASFGISAPLMALRRLMRSSRIGVLRELDDAMLRDIGASGDDIWRVHRLRNGERPTLVVR